MSERTTFIVFRTRDQRHILRDTDDDESKLQYVPAKPCEGAELVEVQRLYWNRLNEQLPQGKVTLTEKHWIIRLTMDELIAFAGIEEWGVILHPPQDENILYNIDWPEIFTYEDERLAVLEIYDGYRE